MTEHQYRVFISGVERLKDTSILFDDNTFTVTILYSYEIYGNFSYNETKIYMQFMGRSFRIFDIFEGVEFIRKLRDQLACIENLVSSIEG